MKSINEIVAIDHIGYAVENMCLAKKFFLSLGYTFEYERIDELRKVNVCVGELAGARVELLAPIKGVKSPIDGILSKMGSTPYHICYQVKNIERAINYLQDAGYTLIEAPEYSEPLGGIVCFLYANEIGIIELIRY